MRPQYSHTMIFFLILISACFCGGIRLKQPPQALDVDHSETVACVLADALECVEQTLVVKLLFEFLGVVAQVFLVLTGLVDDFVKLVALFGKNVV